MTRVRARQLFSCMEVMSMGWASSEILNVFFRYWKSSKRCSGRCLGERFRFPILPSKEGQAWSAQTYVARLFARYFAGVPLQGSPSGQVRIVQFHQSYSYEDFVEGIRPETKDGHIEYAIAPGIFRRICKDAADDLEEKRYVIIIDEINRGNISRIFGELLMLLEYRDLEVELPYQKDGSTFFIPKNVFVIGTMNTTDRSLAQIDYALRRRFFFYRLLPVVGDEAPVLNRWLESQVSFSPDEKQEVLRLFVALNSRVRKELGEHFQIGHSYFMHPDIRTGTGRKRIWEHAAALEPLRPRPY